jgi:hypothetical protein
MVYQIEKLPGEPIVIDSHSEPMKAMGHRGFAEELAGHVQSIEGTVYRITDVLGMSYSFPTLVHVLGEETRSQRPGSASDPRVKMVLVAAGEVANLITMAAGQPQYGGLNLPLFDTREQALAYVRQLISDSP